MCVIAKQILSELIMVPSSERASECLHQDDDDDDAQADNAG